MIPELPYGIYDALLDEELRDVLSRHPELRPVLGKIDVEEQPARYAAFLARIVEQALREHSDPVGRLGLCNRVIELVSQATEGDYLVKHRLVQAQKQVLFEITPPGYGTPGVPRPQTPIIESSLFTGSPQEPQLAHELQEEMRSADSVDILVSFIKWSGLRLLMPAFEDLRDREVPVRIITTSYMGASDTSAIEYLARLPNVRTDIVRYGADAPARKSLPFQTIVRLLDGLHRFGKHVSCGDYQRPGVEPQSDSPGYGTHTRKVYSRIRDVLEQS